MLSFNKNYFSQKEKDLDGACFRFSLVRIQLLLRVKNLLEPILEKRAHSIMMPS